MITLLASVFLVFCCLGFSLGESEADTDYAWKDYYKGQVPSDAIPGGYDKNGRTTYIAGVIHPNGVGFIPANLYPGSYAIAHAGVQGFGSPNHIHTKYVKVLCSKHHRRYQWVPTNIDNIYKLNGTLVRGGQEGDWDMLLGRALYMGEMKVGKVVRPQEELKGLWLPDTAESRAYKNFKDFEILMYNEPCGLCWD